MWNIIVLFLSLLSYLWPVQAVIPAAYFKDITKHFSNAHYSPLMGRVALDSGYIANLRFYGLFQPSFRTNGDRDYARDIPLDKMMELLIVFFPSSAGSLASVSGARDNYGSQATVVDIANMLKFSQELRAVLEEVWDATENIESAKRIKLLVEQYKKMLGPSHYLIDLVKEAMLLEYNPEKEKFESQKQAKERLKQDIFRERIAKEQHSEEIRKRLEDLRIRLRGDLESKNLYPKYTTEQIVLSFFVHRFDSTEDLYRLMFELRERFLKPTSESFDLENKWTLESLTSYPNPSDLDFLFISTYHDLHPPLPYGNHSDPIDHGKCPYVKLDQLGVKSIVSSSNSKFEDCMETAVRHFMNILFYDPESNSFQIPEKIALFNPYLKRFYEQQNVLMVNDGSPQIRGLWNLVVSGISGAIYQKNENALASGFCNFIRIVRSVIGYRISEPIPQSPEGVADELRKLMSYINPTIALNIRINPCFRSTRSQDEVYAYFAVGIENRFHQRFSFLLNQDNDHASVRQISWDSGAAEVFANPINFEDPIFNLVDKRIPRSAGIYELFANGQLFDDEVRISRVINMVQKFRNDLKKQYIPLINRMMQIAPNHTSLNEKAALVAREVVRKGYVFESALEIASRVKDEDFLDILCDANLHAMKSVWDRSEAVYLSAQRLLKLGLPQSSHVHFLTLSGKFDVLDLTHMRELQGFQGSFSANALIFPNSERFRVLNLRGGKIEQLDLGQALVLQKFSCDYSHIRRLFLGIGSALETVEVSGSEIQELNLLGADGLKEVKIFPGAKIGKLLLPNAQSLEILWLYGTIDEMDLSNVLGLKRISFTQTTRIEKLILPDYKIIADPTLGIESQLELRGAFGTVDLSQVRDVEKITLLFPETTISKLICPIFGKLREMIVRSSVDVLDLSGALSLVQFRCEDGCSIRNLIVSESQKPLVKGWRIPIDVNIDYVANP